MHDRARTIEELFATAAELPAHERDHFLDRSCGDDVVLRRHLAQLLRYADHHTPDALQQLAPMAAAAPVEAPPWLTGGAIVDDYQLIRELSRGGMGTVYVARDQKLGRLVAMKFLHQGSRQSPMAIDTPGALLGDERFVIEARATAQCRDDHIVVLYAAGVHQGCPYLVLEYVEGQTLRTLLVSHRRGESRGPRSWLKDKDRRGLAMMRIVEIAVPIARALEAAHAAGIVHRDLKPENIMLTEAGSIKVLDFGIAQMTEGGHEGGHGGDDEGGHGSDDEGGHGSDDDGHEGNVQHRVAAMSQLRGTPLYMSPEQWNLGDEAHRDHGWRGSDIWAFGVILYELALGRHPVYDCQVDIAPGATPGAKTDANIDVWLHALQQRHRPMPSVATAASELGPLGAIIDRCLVKDPAHRISSAAVLRAELEALLPGRRAMVLAQDECPFPGLAAFQDADADRFFGRSDDIARLVAHLRRQPLLVVVGPSGTGKSSLIRAGVIPTLQRSGESWRALIVRPSRHPLVALTDVLGRIAEGEGGPEAPESSDASDASGASDGNSRDAATVARLEREPGFFASRLRDYADASACRVVLLVDQFEELYTHGCGERERLAYLRCLEAAADDASSPVRVILTMRSDFLDRLLGERRAPAAAAALLRSLEPLGPMDRDGLCQALVQPLAAARYRFESPELLAQMLDEVEATPGALPLLQFTAATLWRQRDRVRHLITADSYAACGGVAGALAVHASAVIAAMQREDAALARGIFERLVTPDRTRAIIDLDELYACGTQREHVDRVVAQLIAARLVTAEGQPYRRLTDDGRGDTDVQATLELAHESLIERWPLLRGWLSDADSALALAAQVRIAAKQWREHQYSEDLLWRGQAAVKLLAWRRQRQMQTQRQIRSAGPHTGARADLQLGSDEHRYIEAVAQLHGRIRRRKRGILWALATCAVAFAVVVSLLAVRAQRAADRALEAAVQARNALRMTAAQALEDDPTTALAILREIEEPPLFGQLPPNWASWTRAALDQGVAAAVLAHSEAVYSVDVSPDGTTIATGSSDGVIRLWRLWWTADGSLARYPDGATELRGHENAIISVSFSPDGDRLVSASKDRTARIWDLNSGDVTVLRGHQHQVYSARFSPDGARVVTASWDHSARIWNAAKVNKVGSEVAVLRGHEGWVYTAAFSPDGRQVVTASADHSVRLWRVDDAAHADYGPTQTLTGHDSLVVWAAFSPDGTSIVTTAMDRTVRVWRVDDTGRHRLWRTRKLDTFAHTAEFSADGGYLVVSMAEEGAEIWHADDLRLSRVLRGHRGLVTHAVFTPDGRHVVTASLDKSARVWRLDEGNNDDGGDDNGEAGQGARVFSGHADILAAAVFSPDGDRIATASHDRSARVWWIDGRAPPMILRGHDDVVASVAFSPAGDRVVTASHDGTARIWPLDGAGPVTVLRGHGGRVTGAAFAPDGEHVVTSAHDNLARIWAVRGDAGPEVVAVLEGHGDRVESAAFSHGGAYVVTTSYDGTARIWRVDVRSKGMAGKKTVIDESVVLRGHGGRVLSAQFSPDDDYIVTASVDHTVRIWPVAAALAKTPGAVDVGAATVLRGHEGMVMGAVFAPDGERVASASEDGTLRVWDVGGAAAPVVLRGHDDAVTGVAFAPDGTALVSSSRDHSARLWRDLRPLTADAPRLWRATSYCLPAPMRVRLLSVSDDIARRDYEACRKRVARVND